MRTNKILNTRELQKILKKNGWTAHHQKGSHIIYRNTEGEHLVISVCKCNRMITERLIKQYNLKI